MASKFINVEWTSPCVVTVHVQEEQHKTENCEAEAMWVFIRNSLVLEIILFLVTPLEEGLCSETIGRVNVIILTVGSNTSTSAQGGDCVGLLQVMKRGFNESSLLCLFMHPPLRMFNRTPFPVHMSVYLDITSGTLALSSYTYTSIYSKEGVTEAGEMLSRCCWPEIQF